MATYNGEDFIKEQIVSILLQLHVDDELLIYDDVSTDRTTEVIKSLKDHRIRLIENKVNVGPIRAFERCVSLAQNEVIFLSDQDDIWIEGRLNLLLHELNKHDADLVSSNMILIDRDGKNLNYLRLPPLSNLDSKKPIKNILNILLGRMGYFGCTMAFRRRLLSIALPMPKFIESHDLWLAICANVSGSIRHLEDVTLLHRVHGKNTSIIRRSLFKKVFARFLFIRQFWLALVYRYR